MSNIKRTAAIGSVAILSIAGLAASPASAALSDCTSTRPVCLWNDSDWNGTRKTFTSTSGIIYNLTDYGFNDMMSSWANKMSSKDAEWFHDINAQGGSDCMNPVSSVAYVGWTNSDEASSVAVYSNASTCS